MNSLVFIFSIIQVATSFTEEKKGFLLMAPSSFLLGSKEQICISLHNTSTSVRVQATLFGSFSDQILSSVSSTVQKEGCVSMPVKWSEGDDQLGRLVVRTTGVDSQLTASSERMVRLHKQPVLVLVSTDKPLYKPGQQVRFRVFSLDHKFKPYNAKIGKVWVETPSGIRVQQWTDVNVVRHGLTQFHFTLDDEAFLGSWKIKVQHQSSKVVQKIFNVKEYVQQKFEIEIRPPTEIFPDSRDISWLVCARYLYGEVVQGEVKTEIKLQGSQAADQPTINNAVKLDKYSGCAIIRVKGSELGLSDPLVRPEAINLTATVTEKTSLTSYSTSAVTYVQIQPFTLHLQCSQYFKPGLPYKGKVTMRNMDNRLRMAVGEKIQVCVKVLYRTESAFKLLHCLQYTTDYTSSVTFALPDILDSLNVKLITLIASATDYSTKMYPNSGEVMLLQPSVSHNVKPWFSPSRSYLDVFTHTSLACVTNHTVTVYYSVPSVNSPTPTFFYGVEARGDLLSLSSVIPQEQVVVHSTEMRGGETSLVRAWKLHLTVTHDMSPSMRVIVYYVRGDGEVVAASTSLPVDRCLQNKVRVRWNETQLVPQQRVKLCVRASPDSLCGVTVTDKQLHLIQSQPAHHISQQSLVEHLWQTLDEFKLVKPIRDNQQYCQDILGEEEEKEPPSYELRKKRSLRIPEESSDHVDAITAFDDMGMTVMSDLVLETRPCKKSMFQYYQTSRMSWIFSPARALTPFKTKEANNLIVSQEDDSKIEELEQKLIREYFPETWLWSLVDIGKEGEAHVETVAPDSITSWKTEVVCINDKDGFGLAASPSINVFVPFFLDLDLPYSVKKGEKVTVKVNIYNYLQHSLPVEVSVVPSDGVSVLSEAKLMFCLDKQSLASHPLNISAQAVGLVNLTVTTRVTHLDNCGPRFVNNRSDTITKQLLVKHEGFVERKIQSALICPSESSTPSVTWDMALPEDLVPGSVSLHFTAFADLLGPVFENLDALVTMPMGCGEQNLAKLAPNILILKYMESIKCENSLLKETALNNIKKGYQRQLMFQRKDGSFSAFGDKDDTGSMWLTAAVVKTLSDAKSIISVDDRVLERSISWIVGQQLENGCLPQVGQIFHSNVEDEESDDATTFFLSLVVANIASNKSVLPPKFRSDAVFCLNAATSQTDVYTLSLATLAYVRLGLRDQALRSLQHVLNLTVEEEDVIHWGKPDSSPTYNLAVTSYVVLSLVELGGSENILKAQKAVRWIVTHRNENGGFISTQDTVVALEALNAYVSALPTEHRTETELMVLLTGGQNTNTFRLHTDNRLVRQQLILSSDIPTSLTVTAAGHGCASVQSVLKYNTRRQVEASVLNLQVSTSAVSSVDPCSVQEVKLCVATTKPSHMINMALLTVLLVTGYSTHGQHLNQISHPNLKKWEDEGDQIAFYLTDVTNAPICFSLPLMLKFEVEEALPGVITLIDYYNPEVLTFKEYTLECKNVSPPLQDLMMLDQPFPDDRFDQFHNVDYELETPSGEEGPIPVVVCPPNSSLTNCSHN